MKRIESFSNPRIQEVRKLLKHRRQDRFILEGRKLFHEAMKSGVHIMEIFSVSELWNQERRALQQLEKRDVPVYIIPPSLLRRISDLDTPPGILVVAEEPRRRGLETPIPGPSRYGAMLISIRDPGNFGTMLRSAEAAGCEFIAYTSDCADPFATKVVRASMGSVLRIPLLELKDPISAVKRWKERGVHIYGMIPRAKEILFRLQPQFPSVVLIGSENEGISPEIPVDHEISIPMKGGVESLNAAMAATLCFYHFSFAR